MHPTVLSDLSYPVQNVEGGSFPSHTPNLGGCSSWKGLDYLPSSPPPDGSPRSRPVRYSSPPCGSQVGRWKKDAIVNDAVRLLSSDLRSGRTRLPSGRLWFSSRGSLSGILAMSLELLHLAWHLRIVLWHLTTNYAELQPDETRCTPRYLKDLANLKNGHLKRASSYLLLKGISLQPAWCGRYRIHCNYNSTKIPLGPHTLLSASQLIAPSPYL